MSTPFIGEVNFMGCCCACHGQPSGEVGTYVRSLQSLFGDILLDGQGGITISTANNTILFTLSASAGLGTVTSVTATSASTGLSITGSPITTAGTLTFTLDATLQAFSQLSISADVLPYGSGADAFTTTPFTAFGRSLIDDANAAAGRATLGGTTVGQALFTATNPSAIRFLRINADNSITLLAASDFRIALSLVIGTNVQAWSPTLDDFVSAATVTGANLQLSGNLDADGYIASDVSVSVDSSSSTGVFLLDLLVASTSVFKVLDTGKTTLVLNYASATSAFTITNSSAAIAFDVDAQGNVAILATCSAAAFDGDGSALTNLSATELVSGTVPSARMVGTYSGITGLGTLTTGALGSGFSVVAGAQGGTGVANTGKTITIGGNFATSGAFALTLTLTAATNVTLPTSGTLYGTQTGSITSAQLALSVTDETGSGSLVFATSPALLAPALTSPTFDKTVTAAGTTGNRTINKVAGTVNFAAAATTLTVTNSLVSATSQVLCFIQTDDSTAVLKNVVCSSGQFVIKMATAPTAETAVAFLVII